MRITRAAHRWREGGHLWANRYDRGLEQDFRAAGRDHGEHRRGPEGEAATRGAPASPATRPRTSTPINTPNRTLLHLQGIDKHSLRTARGMSPRRSRSTRAMRRLRRHRHLRMALFRSAIRTRHTRAVLANNLRALEIDPLRPRPMRSRGWRSMPTAATSRRRQVRAGLRSAPEPVRDLLLCAELSPSGSSPAGGGLFSAPRRCGRTTSGRWSSGRSLRLWARVRI